MGIFLDTIPADAHYLNNAVERAIQEVKGCMSRMVADDPDRTGTEAMLLAIGAHSAKEAVSGYSPAQWVLGRLGRSPGLEGDLHEVGMPKLARFTAEQTENDYQESAKRRSSAEAAAIQ